MYAHCLKRIFDFTIALIAILCISPLLIVVTVWLHFANKGAGAFFTQERPGKGEKIFRVIKFKSMTDERDEKGNLLPDEKRLTPIGNFIRKTSIDESSFEYEDFGNGIIRRKRDTLIEGMDVFTFAISRPPKSIEQLMTDYQLDKDNDIDFYLIHQANKMIVDRIVKKLKLPVDKVPYDLEEFGNLGGASIPSLMVTRIREQLQQDKLNRLLCSSFGLGLSWGTMLLNVKNVVIPELIEI